MPNYYKVLQVEPHAGQADIKRAFRRLLKKFHPDRNRGNLAWAEQRTREIVEAYHVLSDERRRRFHDEQLRLQKGSGSQRSSFTTGPYSRDGVAAKCRFILESLLNGNGAEAVKVYEELCERHENFDLYPYLSLKDHLDCKFLLGEEYERQGKLERALELYEEVYREELEGPRLRYFFDEVQDRIVTIYTQRIPRQMEPEGAIIRFRHALRLPLPQRDLAEIRKRLAETLLKVGDEEAARRELVRALRQRPGLKGVQRLCSRLGIQATAL